MANVEMLSSQLTQARNELNNLRKKIHGLQAQHKKDISSVMKSLNEGTRSPGINESAKANEQRYSCCHCGLFKTWKPIGFLKTWFYTKNGTPRQGSISTLSRGTLSIDKTVFNNPQHSLEGLQEYSHVWVFFIFDQNGEGAKGSHNKSKVAPPRLNGERLGVFATRSPHRPNPLGLTLAKLDRVEGNVLHLSGLDILDGTPVIDIKPYIPEYDSPFLEGTQSKTLDTKKTDDAISNEVSGPSSFNELYLNYASNNERKSDESESASVKEHSSFISKDVKEQRVFSSNTTSEKQCTEQSSKVTSSVFSPGNTIERDHSQKNSKSGEETLGVFSSGMTSKRKHLEQSSEVTSEAEDFLKPHLPTSEQDCDLEIKNGGKATGGQSVVPSDNSVSLPSVRTAQWIREPPLPPLEVIFHPMAETQIKCFSSVHEVADYRLTYLKDWSELRSAIESILKEDPRSSYRRKKCPSQLYYLTVDNAHVTSWFDEHIAEVLRVKPLRNLQELVNK